MASKRCAGLTSWVHLDEKIEETGAAPLSVSRRAVQASDSTRALRSPIVHWSWGSGLGLPPPAALLVGRSLRPGRGCGRTPLLAAAEFHCIIRSTHTITHVCARAQENAVCASVLAGKQNTPLVQCRVFICDAGGAVVSKYGLGCDTVAKICRGKDRHCQNPA